MAFSQKFLKIPIRVVSRSNADMGVTERGDDEIMKIDPRDISRYYPVASDEDEDGERDCVKVEFKGTDAGVVVYCNIKRFEEILDTFY